MKTYNTIEGLLQDIELFTAPVDDKTKYTRPMIQPERFVDIVKGALSLAYNPKSQAHELAQILGISRRQLQEVAEENRSPFQDPQSMLSRLRKMKTDMREMGIS